MDVICHPHVGVYGKSIAAGGFNQSVAEELIVRLGGKYYLPVVAALDDVLRLARNDVTGKTGHCVRPRVGGAQ